MSFIAVYLISVIVCAIVAATLGYYRHSDGYDLTLWDLTIAVAVVFIPVVNTLAIFLAVIGGIIAVSVAVIETISESASKIVVFKRKQ